MALVKMFNGKQYKLVKKTPYKGEANDAKKTYSKSYNVRMEKQGNVWYVWARRK